MQVGKGVFKTKENKDITMKINMCSCHSRIFRTECILKYKLANKSWKQMAKRPATQDQAQVDKSRKIRH